MKLNARSSVVSLSLVWLLSVGVVQAAQQIAADTDHGNVYRIQPSLEGVQMVPVSTGEIKPGLVYNYYNERLGRRAWGFARDDGSFQYAFGEGTTLPTSRFDFRLATQEQSELLERAAPGLERALATTGRVPDIQLDSAGQWRVYRQTSAERVFDLQTGHRWEWHGERRVAVLHTYGDQWVIVDGRYRPATGGLGVAPCGCGFAPCGCALPRAGSAAWVVRTGEPHL